MSSMKTVKNNLMYAYHKHLHIYHTLRLLHLSAHLCCYRFPFSSSHRNIPAVVMLLAPVLSPSSSSNIPPFFHIKSAHHEAFVFSCLKKKTSPATRTQKYIFSLSLTHTHIYTHTYTHAAVRTNTHAHRQSAVPFPQLVARKQNTLPVPALHTYTHTQTHTHMCTRKLCNCPLHTLKGT